MVTSTAITGSSTTRPASSAASWKAIEPASSKAIALESTLWVDPSTSRTRASTTGRPPRRPFAIAPATPRRTALANSAGIHPPEVASSKTRPASRGAGPTSSTTWAKSPTPPFWRESR